MVDVAAQDAPAGGVEGCYQRQIPPSQQLADPLGHFFGSLVGEGDRHDVPGAHPPFTDQVGDAVGDDAGLARAGAGQDQQRPFAVQHGLFLWRVEMFEKIHVVRFRLSVQERQRKKARPLAGLFSCGILYSVREIIPDREQPWHWQS